LGCIHARLLHAQHVPYIYICFIFASSYLPSQIQNSHLLPSTFHSNISSIAIKMPTSTPSQSTALHILVRKAESLITLYPQRFPSIEAAKAFISDLCNLDLTNAIDDKVAFLVAIHAFEDGEFHLDTPPPSRQVLRSSLPPSLLFLVETDSGIQMPLNPPSPRCSHKSPPGHPHCHL
jgi:hypothetical protein